MSPMQQEREQAMSATDTKVVRSILHWVVPPEDFQPLNELDWVWADVMESGRIVVRDTPPTQEEINAVIEELSPYFNWEKAKNSPKN